MSACPFRPFGGTCPFSSLHAPRFREPPYDPGRSDFPSPVLTLACPPTAFPQRGKLKCWHTYTPLRSGLHVGLGPSLMARPLPVQCPGPHQGPPDAQRSFARSRCYLSQGGVQRHLRGHYPSFVAHMTSCDKPNPSRRLRFPLVGRSLQVATSPCWEMALPDVISACLSLDARAPITAVCEVLIPVSSPTASAFPALSSGRLFRNFPPKRLLSGRHFATAAIS